VSEVKADEGRGVAYEPARDPDTMTIKSVVDALEQRGATIILCADRRAETTAGKLEDFQQSRREGGSKPEAQRDLLLGRRGSCAQERFVLEISPNL